MQQMFLGLGASKDSAHIDDVFNQGAYVGNASSHNIKTDDSNPYFSANSASFKNSQGGDAGGLNWTDGGMVIIKNRGAGSSGLWDTIRGDNKTLRLDSSDAQATESNTVSWPSGYNDRFLIGSNSTYNPNHNPQNDHDFYGQFYMTSFAKKEKFFDIIQYTGNGEYHGNPGSYTGRPIAHNLGCTPKWAVLKRTDASSWWWLKIDDSNYGNRVGLWQGEAEWYQENSPTSGDYRTIFKSDGGTGNTWADANNVYLSTGQHSNGNNSAGVPESNVNGATYMLYLFACDQAEFGADGDEEIASGGIYTGNGSNTGPTVTLGWEPQFVQIRRIDGNGPWNVLTEALTMQNNKIAAGASPSGQVDQVKWPSGSGTGNTKFNVKTNGFQILTSNSDFNHNGGKYFYYAIRRRTRPASRGDNTLLIQTYNGISNEFHVGVTPNIPFPGDLHWHKQYGSFSGNTNNQDFFMANRAVGSQYKYRVGATQNNPDINGAEFYNRPLGYECFHKARITGGDYVSVYTGGGGGKKYMRTVWRRSPELYDQFYLNGTNTSHALKVTPSIVWTYQTHNNDASDTYRGGSIWLRPGLGNTVYAGWPAFSNRNDAPKIVTNTSDIAFTGITDTNISTSACYYSSSGTISAAQRRYLCHAWADKAGTSKSGTYTGGGSSDVNTSLNLNSSPIFIIIKNLSSGSTSWCFMYPGNDLFTRVDDVKSMTVNGSSNAKVSSYSQGGGKYGITAKANAGDEFNASGDTYFYYAICAS